MQPLTIISDQQAFADCLSELTQQQWVGIDTEFMRVKTYSPVLCLIQISTAEKSWCIDPLGFEDISAMTALFANADIEKILHSCRQDFEALDTRMPFEINGLFDSQIAAAFAGEGDQVSYAAMVEKVSGVILAKSHTRADWQKRPLSDDEMIYAMDDVKYLPAIRDYLHEKLAQLGRLSWFEEECQKQCNPALWTPDIDQIWRKLKGAAALPVAVHETAKQLAIWREKRAIASNRPREWVLSTDAILSISKQSPQSVSELKNITSINPGVVRKSGDHIVEICQTTPKDNQASPLWQRSFGLEGEDKSRAKAIMKFIKEVAESNQFSPSLLANRHTVESFVRGKTDLPLFTGWRYALAGEQIIKRWG